MKVVSHDCGISPPGTTLGDFLIFRTLRISSSGASVELTFSFFIVLTNASAPGVRIVECNSTVVCRDAEKLCVGSE